MTTSRNYPWERALVIIDRLHIRSHFHWLPLAGPACLPAGIEIGTGHKPTLRCVHRCAHAAKQWTHETGELRAKSVRAFCSRQQPPERLVCQLRLIKANAMGLGDSWTGETQGLWRISLRLEHSEKSFFPTVGRWNFHCAVVQLGRLDGWFFFHTPCIFSPILPAVAQPTPIKAGYRAAIACLEAAVGQSQIEDTFLVGFFVPAKLYPPYIQSQCRCRSGDKFVQPFICRWKFVSRITFPQAVGGRGLWWLKTDDVVKWPAANGQKRCGTNLKWLGTGRTC